MRIFIETDEFSSKQTDFYRNGRIFTETDGFLRKNGVFG
jgi:hypothetical protein